MINVLSFGDRILPGDYRIHSRFREAVNFTACGRMVCVVTGRVGGGPINIAVSGLDFSGLLSLRVREDSCAVDGAALPRAPLYDSGLPAGDGVDISRARRNLRGLEKLVVKLSHPKSLAFLLDDGRRRHFSSGFESALVAKAQAAARDFRRGDAAAGARAMRGAGFGLTPSGDDFLAGWLWGLHARQRLDGGDVSAEIEKIYASGRTEHPLSAAFLRCAREGRYFERLRNLLAALLYGGEPQVARRAGELLAVGETSGADMSVGFLMALRKEAGVWS